MKILIVTPAPAGSRAGNRVTALRWSRLLRDLGYRVAIAVEYVQQRCDLMIALHARRSAISVRRFRERHPEHPLVLALTGTDLYGDIHTDPEAQLSLRLADRLVVLQDLGVDELPAALRHRARTIHQSIRRPPGRHPPRKDMFEVSVVGHLRPVKDPFRTAEAARLLPPASRVAVTHVGSALSADMAQRALTEARENPRYHWLGELPRWRTIRLIARSQLLVLTSEMEGGAHVVSEALACRTPILSTRISGSIGLLGESYPGYFPFGETAMLTALMERAESDGKFCEELRRHCRQRERLVDPGVERQRWKALVKELS